MFNISRNHDNYIYIEYLFPPLIPLASLICFPISFSFLQQNPPTTSPFLIKSCFKTKVLPWEYLQEPHWSNGLIQNSLRTL